MLLALMVEAHGQSPSDFAYRLPLVTSGDSAYFRVELPPSVHEGAVQPDLGDLRVFNGSGSQVPVAFLPPPETKREAGSSVGLPLFPLRVEGTRRDLGDLSISVQRTASGTRVDLATRDGKPIIGERIAGYLVDASAVHEPLAALTLPLAARGGINVRVRVDASDDLSAWRTLVAAAPVVDLEYAGRRLTRDRIELPRVRARYLRLSFNADSPAPDLTGARGEFADHAIDAPRHWRHADAVSDSEHPDEYAFDLGGTFPADRVTLELPEINTVAPARLFVRPTDRQPWRAVAATVFYRLRQDGGDVTNEAAAVATNDRYWKVTIDPRSGGLGGKSPRLSVGWHPRVVVFAARGGGPFELAYGSATAKSAALPIETLVPGYDRAKPVDFPLAEVGAATLPPAVAALKQPIDTRRWVLWGSLVLAAIVLGVMALKLSRQMRRAGADSSGNGATGDEPQ